MAGTTTNEERNVKTTRNNFMTALFAVLLMVIITAFSGCGETSKAEAVEYNTPTGCLKEKARYFSPELGKCIEVSNINEATRLNAYRRVYELADENAGKVEYAIYFKKYETIEETEKLWAELREHGAEMINLGGSFPDNSLYDPVQEWEFILIKNNPPMKPRSWGNAEDNYGCGWMKIYDQPADTIHDMLKEGLKMLEAERPRPQMRKAILEDGDCRMELMIVVVDAKFMREWLDRHLDKILGVQPHAGIFDKSLPPLGQIQRVKEGE